MSEARLARLIHSRKRIDQPEGGHRISQFVSDKMNTVRRTTRDIKDIGKLIAVISLKQL